MTTGARWGMTVPFYDRTLAASRELVAELPALGYTDVWSAEVNGVDGFVPLALAAEWAPGVRLGSAIVPVSTRGPGLLAMSAATLADLAPDRFVLGIGASSPAIVERWNAGEFVKPFARTRDTLRFLKKALAGEKVTERYETFEVKGFRLERAPKVPPKIVLAALRPRMLRLAAEEADGAITNWLSPQDVRKVRSEIGPDTELIARLFVCVSEDAEKVRELGRRMLAGYLTVPVYAAFHDWLGRGEVLRPMHEAWAAGDRPAALRAIPDEVVDALIVHGDAATCRARIRQYVDNGLSTPVLAPIPGGGIPIAQAVRDLAPTGE
ncbi:probable F420-dependent oxidoreductase, MSMEG_4141 family/probable F420-dependent oxidoreductase, Rv3093c family [Streptosporangium canum]|uniref:Probable F420-dependent oxidoreductase, MSMEG_4141 family/probable F420-dependent oxidoreductase, Rv3093c family n=1 Tax=Streptosporangium canum TaxID=324952 RepID=A0A1I3S074_9ACTN|nr:LLM class F420-dependent oxidoreductase [Streptosporangium canum]SFJ50916.1 probable F420-dependent oxidoreductase, MSMEG_4141 family/probable F420-dependent oxidoreductase, Rv3093c family [Streptosporangium canum]